MIVSLEVWVLVADNLKQIEEHLCDAAARSGRDRRDVQFLVVTKQHAAERIQEVIDAGHTLFGESRIQEAKQKIPVFPNTIRWHLIGHLQSNKAKFAVALFDLIHSVDSISLAEELSKRASRLNKSQPILLQVNISGEGTKSGVSPENLPQLIDISAKLPGVRLAGLMTIPPFFNDPEKSRPFYASLRTLSESIKDHHWPDGALMELSMGMSHDYVVAVEEGSTIVRIGTAVFGSR
jgi:PLP dependent protein